MQFLAGQRLRDVPNKAQNQFHLELSDLSNSSDEDDSCNFFNIRESLRKNIRKFDGLQQPCKLNAKFKNTTKADLRDQAALNGYQVKNLCEEHTASGS